MLALCLMYCAYESILQVVTDGDVDLEGFSKRTR